MKISDQEINILLEKRNEFPSLQRKHNGNNLIYLDGPGGTQVPQPVIDSISDYYKNSNSNTHGNFITTRETDKVISDARKAVADFLGAESEENISFGANMTTLNFSLSKAILRSLNPGDEILISQLDHESNRGPWLNLRENGIIVKEINIHADCTLDYKDLENKISERTRLVAVGFASNAFGTVNDIERIRKLTYKYNALLLVDAVHYAPHFSIDVKKLDVDFLLCSAYKFYGPHVGILYSKEGVLDSLQTDSLRTQSQIAPYKIETGTQNHAALAGVTAAINFISEIGKGESRQEKIISAINLIHNYEFELAAALYSGLKKISSLEIYGLPFDNKHRAPTISFTINGMMPDEVCTQLGEKGICAWDGHFYAIKPVELLGLSEKGGLTRMGFSMYNTIDEVNRVIEEVKNITKNA